MILFVGVNSNSLTKRTSLGTLYGTRSRRQCANRSGTFSVTPAQDCKRTAFGGVTGTIDCRRMVVGPSIVVQRTIEPVAGKRAFRIVDDLSCEVGSDYMWLYHPNFPVAEGTEFVSSETLVVPRADDIAKWGLKDYRTYRGVGTGHARWPPATDEAGVAEENFEQCFVMKITRMVRMP